MNIVHADVGDAALIVEFMKKLGKYQLMLEKTVVTEEKVIRLLNENAGEAIFAEMDGETVGFIYYYMNSSAFTGGKGIYIDAFYVNESMRGKGIGKQMMEYMSRLALERGCKRVEWVCLDWNTSSIKFYKNLGANEMNVFTTYRMDEECIRKNAAGKE